MHEKVDLMIVNASEILTLPNIVRGRAREKDLGLIYDGVIAIKNGMIEFVGESKDLSRYTPKRVIDAEGGIVTPGLIDSHTHLVYYGSREDEFEEMLLGGSYEEILSRGGGIARTMRETSKASIRDLVNHSIRRIKSIIRSGVTTIEIKSGYGLDLESEIRILDSIEILRSIGIVDVIPTLLAHIQPPGMRREEFIRIFVEHLLREAKIRSFPFVDVFCDRGGFNPDESRFILSRARDAGFGIRIHADELSYIGCSDLGVDLNASSIDHLNHTPQIILREIARRDITATLTPTTALYIARKKPDVDTLLRENAIISIATDHSPALMNSDIIQTLNLGALYLGIPPANLIASVTVNAAYSLGLRFKGSIKPGFIADLVIWSIRSYRYIGYSMNRDSVKTVIRRGDIVYSSED
ncbi:MAG: imidazolonepropionase [Sulfolobales archaeon]